MLDSVSLRVVLFISAVLAGLVSSFIYLFDSQPKVCALNFGIDYGDQ